MTYWITSDLHFGHANIKKFCPLTRDRFADVEDMERGMIDEWNRNVQPGDTVYIVGDLAFTRPDKAVQIMARLNGTKILIAGNHDRKNLQDADFRACFAEIHDVLNVTVDGVRVVMCHFPMLEWDQMHRGAVHFYGHVHGGETGLERYRARDVAFDATGRVVSNMHSMIKHALRGEIKEHHVSTRRDLRNYPSATAAALAAIYGDY